MEPGLRRLYIFGAGGSGREIAWLAGQVLGDAVPIAFIVDDLAYVTAPVNGISVQLVSDVAVQEGDRFVVAVGDAGLRRKASVACIGVGLQPATLVHPRVEMSRFVSLGTGSVLCAGSILTTNIALGEHVHVNVDCTISHDVRIGDFSTLSPGVHVSGHVHIGKDVLIGTGANIINGSATSPLVIEDGAKIAAGACVTSSVAPGALMAGVPAVRKR
ncbi:hypothetical protein [Luteimonas arsenica]|uniref:hypothetical protein n=1 Tax=Luteimonas arsenica TaxID=1586242 RepID=UPI0014042AA1|nr:hypothetical protein [Luteimonas arsenica]